MKKWIVIAIVIIGVVVLIYFKFNWQTITMLFAGLTAPFRYLFKLLGGESEEDIREKHATIREQERRYQKQLEATVLKRRNNIQELETQIKDMDIMLDSLKKKRMAVNQEIEDMNLNELQLTGRNYFGS